MGGVERTEDLDRRIGGIAALDQPLRRDLYRLLAARGGWVTREEAAAELGIPRSVAAFHLDKLAEVEIVEVRFERTTGRSGPGAGRPAKLYRRSSHEVAASVPERHYDLAGSLLAQAVAEAGRTGTPIAECLRTTAHTAGHAAGAAALVTAGRPTSHSDRTQTLLKALAEHGYEPGSLTPDEIALVNCPFHRLAEQHRALICEMNLDFLSGLLEGIDAGGPLDVRLAPQPGYCCVRIAAA